MIDPACTAAMWLSFGTHCVVSILCAKPYGCHAESIVPNYAGSCHVRWWFQAMPGSVAIYQAQHICNSSSRII
jgi:hypothetical protein